MALIEINWRPSDKQLRTFGVACLVVTGILGIVVFFRHHIVGMTLTAQTATRVALALWTLGAVSCVLGLVAPRALRPLYLVLTAVTLPIGFVVSHVVLWILFYLVLTPMGLVMRLTGWDPMQRSFQKDAKSYWARRPAAPSAKRYLRQY